MDCCKSWNAYLATYSLWSAMHELSLLLIIKYIGEMEPVHFYSFKSYN